MGADGVADCSGTGGVVAVEIPEARSGAAAFQHNLFRGHQEESSSKATVAALYVSGDSTGEHRGGTGTTTE